MGSANHNKYSQLIAYDPNRLPKPRTPSIDSQTWELHRTRIVSLYHEQNRTLDEVRAELNSQGLTISRHQLILQLQKWGVRKHQPRLTQQGHCADTSSITVEEHRNPSEASKTDPASPSTDAHDDIATVDYRPWSDPVGDQAYHISDEQIPVLTTPNSSFDWGAGYLPPAWNNHDVPFAARQQLHYPRSASNAPPPLAQNSDDFWQARCMPASTSRAIPYFHSDVFGVVPHHTITSVDHIGLDSHGMPSITQYSSSPNGILSLSAGHLVNNTMPVKNWQPEDSSNSLSSCFTTFDWNSELELGIPDALTELHETASSTFFANNIAFEAPIFNSNLATNTRQSLNNVGAFPSTNGRCSCCNGGCASWSS